MTERQSISLYDAAENVLHRMRHGGILCTVIDHQGADNVLTLGWGQIGPAYHDHPICIIAITPRRYSWRFIQEVPEFVLGIPDDDLQDAVALCGTKSGRDMDKFEAANLTRVPSVHVKAPSIRECPINIECRAYTRVMPPHELLTPEHRRWPVEEQHTIYFAEVLGTYRW